MALSRTGKAYSWGDGSSGQLGSGTYTKQVKPTEISIPKILGETPFITKISSGLKHSGFITKDGQVLLSGCNKDGQLGLGNNISTSRLTLNNYLFDKTDNIACGTAHTLVLSSHNNKLQSFGKNDCGQLGCEVRKESNIPIAVGTYMHDKKIKKIVAGDYSGYLDESGKLYLWGMGRGEVFSPQ